MDTKELNAKLQFVLESMQMTKVQKGLLADVLTEIIETAKEGIEAPIYEVATNSKDGLLSASYNKFITKLSNSVFLIANIGGGTYYLDKTNNATSFTINFKAKSIYADYEETIPISINAATTSKAGLLSSSDKSKLNGIADNANNYSLPIATASVLGGVKSSTTGTTASRDYLVQINSDGTMKVNVPWSNTTYNPAVANGDNGLMTGTDKAKLDGIAAGANNYTLPAANSTTLGGVKKGVSVAYNSSTDNTTLVDLITSLKNAGIIDATDSASAG